MTTEKPKPPRRKNWIAVTLHWPVCPDGMAIRDYGVRGTDTGGGGARLLTGEPSGRYFEYASDQRVTSTLQRHRITDRLDNPLVIRFVNARDDAARLRFLSRFGLPVRAGIEPAPRQLVSSVMAMQADLEGLLKLLNEKDWRALAVPLKEAMAGIRAGPLETDIDLTGEWPQRIMRARSPYAFMLLEIENAMCAGDRLGHCVQCGKAWLYGQRTKGRSTRRYCDTKCRKAAERARKARPH